MQHAILGPTLSDVQSVTSDARFTLASPFYSRPRLDHLNVSAKQVELLVRFDPKSVALWVAQAIAPDALLDFWKRHAGHISVYYSTTAHAKVYASDRQFLVGSANLTVRGLGGLASEILWRETSLPAVKEMAAALELYRLSMTELSIEVLEDYVSTNARRVSRLQKASNRSPEAYLPEFPVRPPRLGDYAQFLGWLDGLTSGAAKVILARAHGDGQLSGHIRMNFYGIRQFLIANPNVAMALRKRDPATYALYRDTTTQDALASFVRTEATSEGGLNVDTWRTYLPEASGGKPKTGGGTSGNLNRMLPLMSTFMFR